MAYSNEVFGNRLALARKSKGFKTQADFARKAEVDVNSIARYEAGINSPNLDTACKIASTLGISLDSLTGLQPLIIDD